MAKVTNSARGPRGIRTESGELVMIDPGQTAEGDFPASEVKDFKAMLAGEAGEAPEADEPDADKGPKPLAKMNKAELLAAAKEAGVTTAADDEGKEVALDDATNKQLIAAIEKAAPPQA